MEEKDDKFKLSHMEVDYSSTVDEKLPQCEQLAKSGKLSEALDILLSLEKQTRTGSDTHSTGRILVAMVKLCFEQGKWDQLNETLVLLTKRRAQIKQAVTKMVQEACTYVDRTPNLEVKLKLIDTLRTITAGKIYVENERARLTRTLAKIKEDEGDITEAATVLQELQVETFGSMEKREKVEFILEQMRLCLAKKDYVRTQIISKKISTKFFEEPNSQDLKLKYYQLMILLDQHEGSYLSICRHYRAVSDTSTIKEVPAKRQEALRYVVLYALLAPYDNEQSDMTHRILLEKALEEIPLYKELLERFCQSEVWRWKDLCTRYEAELRQVSVSNPPTDVFSLNTEEGNARWKDLKSRIVEHNMRVMAKYYTRIQLSRMADLLDLTETETEDFLSQLVIKKTVTAKIDRPAGIIHFQHAKDPSCILNDWSNNTAKLMSLLNHTSHLITKELMVNQSLGTKQKSLAGIF